MKLLAYLFSLSIVSVHSDNEYKAMMRQSCQSFATGIHANQDPLEERASRGTTVFEFTYQKGHSVADQFQHARAAAFTGESNIGNSLEGILESIDHLQAFYAPTFTLDSLAHLDGSLGSPLGVSKLDLFSSLPFGFTYSNEYKYEREQIRKGQMTLYKAYYKLGIFRLLLDDHALKLSTQFTADLEVASKMAANQSGGHFIVRKYGSLYLADAVFGGSVVQTDFIPNSVFKRMKSVGELSIVHFFWGNREEGEKLKASIGNAGVQYHRRTSLSARGGGFPPKSLNESQLLNWEAQARKYPAILYARFVPLSKLISHPTLKKQVAQLTFTQLLTGLALNVLDTDLFTQKVRSALSGAKFPFRGLLEYAQQTEQQMRDYATGGKNGLLANGTVSPFVKMDAITKALDFIKLTKDRSKNGLDLWGLYAFQREATLETLSQCVHKKNSWFDEAGMKKVEDALKRTSPLVDYFQALADSFTLWSPNNEHLKGFQMYTKNRIDLVWAKQEVDVLLIRAHYNLRGFIANCRDGN